MKKYTVAWMYDGRWHYCVYDSLLAAEMQRMQLLANGYEIKDVSIHVKGD